MAPVRSVGRKKRGGAMRALIGHDSRRGLCAARAHLPSRSPLALVMVLRRLLGRRSLTALGAACARRGLGRSAGARLTAAGARGRGRERVGPESPGGCHSPVVAVRPAAFSEASQRRPRPAAGRWARTQPAGPRRAAAESRWAAAADAVFYRHRSLTLSDGGGLAGWGRERLHSSWVRL